MSIVPLALCGLAGRSPRVRFVRPKKLASCPLSERLPPFDAQRGWMESFACSNLLFGLELARVYITIWAVTEPTLVLFPAK